MLFLFGLVCFCSVILGTEPRTTRQVPSHRTTAPAFFLGAFRLMVLYSGWVTSMSATLLPQWGLSFPLLQSYGLWVLYWQIASLYTWSDFLIEYEMIYNAFPIDWQFAWVYNWDENHVKALFYSLIASGIAIEQPVSLKFLIISMRFYHIRSHLEWEIVFSVVCGKGWFSGPRTIPNLV